MTMNSVAQSRRTFLATAAALAAGTAFSRFRAPETETDDEICERLLARGKAERLYALPMGELVVRIAQTFTACPYKGGTLEEPGEEHLVVNLREFDCVSFVESSVALARAVKRRCTGADGFRKELQVLRYRGGILHGYPSRLHYFTDWIADNALRGNVKDLSRDLGGIADNRPLTFMTTHRSAYPHLADDGNYAAVGETERIISRRPRYAVPAAAVSRALSSLRDGDIIGITTGREGLDCSHTGLVAINNGSPKFLHAPLSGGSVQLSAGSLAEYVSASAGRTGIVVARPLEPQQ